MGTANQVNLDPAMKAKLEKAAAQIAKDLAGIKEIEEIINALEKKADAVETALE